MRPSYSLLLRALLCMVCILPLAANAQFTKLQQKKKINVAVLIYPGVEVLDMNGPLDVFIKAGRIGDNSYHIYTVAGSSEPLNSQDDAITLVPKYTVQSSPRADIIIIPGCSPQRITELHGDRQFAGAELHWLKQQYQQGANLLSVCTGSIILSWTGILNNKKATTHFMSLDTLHHHAPQVQIVRGERFVDEGNVITCGGITSGIDGALHVVETISDPRTADIVASVLQYNRDQPLPVKAPASRTASLKKVKGMALPYCPICKMELDGQAEFTAAYQHKTYGFCSKGCKRNFEAQPAAYIK